MRKRLQSWGAGLALVLTGGLVVAACGTSASAQTVPTQTSVAKIGVVESTANAAGSVRAQADLTLSMTGTGPITEVLVAPGDRVAAGQPLIRTDARELELQMEQAEANLASAQAQYEQKKAGASQKDLEQAEAAVSSAQAQYAQTVQGTTTPQDIANAEAALRSAQAQYAATVKGTTTEQDTANGEAALRSAEAKLAAVQAGTTKPEDITNAQAALTAAEAKLDEVKAGPAQADIDAAVQQVNQAKDSRVKQASQLSNAKEQARIAMEQAANDLRSAQQRYGAAKLIYDEATRTGKDPNIPVQKNPVNKGYRDLTDAKLRQYKSDFEAAELAMKNAEQALTQRQLAYEDAKTQEIAGLQTADSQILAAQANLDKVKAGASDSEIAQAQASVDQARANLEKLQRPPDPNDVTQAQAAVDQAKANLEKLRRPADPNDVTKAQASVDQAQANLAKLQRPADPNDVAQAQASVDQAQATLTDLQAGPAATDLAIALASVKQSEAARDLQRYKLDEATLRAPFAGVVADVAAVPGQPSTASAGLLTLVDDSRLSIDVHVAESDIARVAIDQPARVTFDALAGQTITGKVSAIAPKATVESNVVSYLVTVTLDNTAESAIKTGMTANVALVTAQRADVLTIPNRAVQTQGQQKVVQVQYQGQQFSVPVQIGLVGDSVSEVTAGLKENDVVVLGGSQAQTSTNRAGGFGFPGGAVGPRR